MADFDQQQNAAPAEDTLSPAQADSRRGSRLDAIRAVMMQMFLQHLEVIEELRRLHEQRQPRR